jgi:hypothetical protein
MDKNYNYKWTKGFGIAILITLVLIVGAAFAQTSPNTPSGYSIDSQTGNLIQNPTMTSGTGWTTSGMSGSYTPDGYIFSYASGTIEQNINLNSINFGYQNTSAVFATSIMYGFKYRFQCANQIGGIKNLVEAGNDCSDLNGPQDTLHATFTAYKSDNTVDYTATYQLGLKNINDGNPAYNPTWQQLAETYTFSNPRGINLLGSAKLSITGMDAGYWGCNPDCYGPQIKDAYMRLNYSVDPCILNPAFNPSCPGFQNILQGSKSPTFYYSYNIAQSLPHIGGGVVLHGYDYGFNWYNYGACYNTFMFWCTDWRTDGGGNINFRISDKNNTTMLQQQWYVSGNNNAGSFSSRHLFTESKNSLDMGSVQWWASDVWNHFGWVGWTRPIWTPDPCYTNGLYSPNCSNFQQTLTQVVADIKAQQEKIAALNPSSTSITPTGSVTVTLNNVNSTNPSVTVNTVNEPQQNNRTGVSQAQTLVATEIPAVVLRNANQNARSFSAAQRAIAEANQLSSTSQRDAENIAENNVQSSISSSINTLENEQTNIANVQVNRANQVNISSIITQPTTQSTQQIIETKKEELPIQVTSATPITIESAAQILMPNAMFKSVELAVALPNLPPANPTRVQEENKEQSFTFSSQEQPSVFVQPVTPPEIQQTYTPIEIQQAYAPPSITTLPLQAPTTNVIESPVQVLSQPVAPVAVTEAEQPQQQRNFTTDKTNPINDIIDNKPVVAEQKTETNLAAVNRNAQNNEVAGSVDINNIAVVPVGFNAYNVALRDAAFYAPKEIYRNQKTVDNVRALRSLASDRLHQEMVDQQYRR